MTVRALVVDDSAFIRTALTKMLESDPNIRVIGTASDGEDALEKVRKLKPDIMTLDIEMPKLDGVSVLRRVMRETPLPVIMISSHTDHGAEQTIRCLHLGAVDYILKDRAVSSTGIVNQRDELLMKVRAVVARRMPMLLSKFSSGAKERRPPSVVRMPQPRVGNADIVVIGASTGGPLAVRDVVTRLPPDFPVPLIVIQHMPPYFVKHYAESLRKDCPVGVKEAEEGETFTAGTVYLAPGGNQLQLKSCGKSRCRAVVAAGPPDSLYKPCIDITMRSVAETFDRRALGIILTGMGSDGVEGLRDLQKRGAMTIAQDEASCTVFGMPKAAVEAGVAGKVVGLDAMADEIVAYV